MAAEASLFPDVTMGSSQSDMLKDDLFLQDLINNQGVQGDLLALLDMPNDSLQHGAGSHGAVGGSLSFDPLLNFPVSPVNSEGYSTESSSTGHLNSVRSPTASTTSVGGGSVFDQQSMGGSPSHSPLAMTSSDNAAADFLGDPSQWGMGDMSAEGILFQSGLDEMLPTSSEVTIDVDSLRASTSAASAAAASPPSPDTTDSSGGGGGGKALTLVLSDEEKKLLSEEGIALPTDMPLTKTEQKHLKRVRRKIKNKLSAQESRKKKKEYVEGLEDRVKMSTEKYQKLSKEADVLRMKNKSLSKQLQELQEVVAKFLPSKAKAGTAGTILMVMVLSFSLFLVPLTPDNTSTGSLMGRRMGSSRNLLFAETDEYGNVIDPNSNKIISVAGGKSPFPLPPWTSQTPAVLRWMNKTDDPLPESADKHGTEFKTSQESRQQQDNTL